MRPNRPMPRTRGPLVRPYSSPTLASLSPSMSSRRYSAGSQRRRRGRTALVRSWRSALDNQLTEARAILILASPPHQGTERASVNTAVKGSRFTKTHTSLALSPHNFIFPASGRCGVLYVHTKFSIKGYCIIINIPGYCLPFIMKIFLFEIINFIEM